MTESIIFKTLVSTEDLAPRFNDPQWVIVDCTFSLADEGEGERLYDEHHIPGAIYAHLNRDLSSAPTGTNGRHPLPDLDQFAARLGSWGIDGETQVVAYDDAFGTFAARMWWMLRYLGHEAVAVLDGGLAKWLREGKPTRAGVETPRAAKRFLARPREALRVTVDKMERLVDDPNWLIIDARAPERFRGEIEPLDPVAGHIPGAVNHFHERNLARDGTFAEADALRVQFSALCAGRPGDRTVCYCGSGVTACHNLLAMEHAGIRGAKLYPGSWSEWCADPSRPVASEE